MKLKRRNFLLSSGALLSASLSAEFLLSLSGSKKAALASGAPEQKILVLVQLSGGNDGLNSVVPYSNPAYLKLRPSIGIKPEQVLKINDKVGLNPHLAAFETLFKENKLSIIQGVGYPNPNRSHFRSIEIWQTAEPKKIKETGWLGRYIDLCRGGRKQDANVFPAINVDPILPKTLSAEHVVVPSISELDRFTFKTASEADRKFQLEAFQSIYEKYPLERPYVEELRRIGLDTTKASDRFAKLAAQSKSVHKYPNSKFGKQLQFIATLINGGVDCPVYNLSLSGFDTHTNEQNPHGKLLQTLSEGIGAFMQDLAQSNMDQNVLIMTFSEFGRRVAENGGRGTDHGTAAPVFLIGSELKGGLVGEHPSLTDLDDGDLKHQIDFRCVYASILDRWFGADSQEVLGDKFDKLDLFKKT